MDVNDIAVNIHGPHDGVYFAMAVFYRDTSRDDIDAYMAQVFNAMIQFGIVTKGEKMIALSHMIPTLNPHFTVIERFNYRTNKPNIEEVLQLSFGVLENVPVDNQPIAFLVDYDQTKPIQYYGRIVRAKADFKQLISSIKSVFVEFTNCDIGYIMTKKANPT